MSDKAVIESLELSGEWKMKVVDQLGRTLIDEEFTALKGSISREGQALASGSYQVILMQETKLITAKLLVD